MDLDDLNDLNDGDVQTWFDDIMFETKECLPEQEAIFKGAKTSPMKKV